MNLLGRVARTLHRLLFTRYLTPRRLWNTLMVRIQEWCGWTHVRARPEIIVVEPTNACNSTCRLCPVGEGRRARPASFLDMQTYQRLIDELGPWTRRVHFHNWGDPLLHKRLTEKIRYAHERGLVTFVATTLHAFSPECADEIVKSGLNEISISLHATDQQAYEAYQPGRSFSRTLENIRLLVDARKHHGSSEPTINITFVKSRKNEHQEPELPSLVASLGVESCTVTEVSLNARFLWSDLQMRDRRLDEATFLDEARSRAEEWCTEEQRRALDQDFGASGKLRTCDRLWRVGFLNSDGGVPPCCEVYRKDNDFGQLEEGTPFMQIWNNELFRAARRSFRASAPEDPLLVCTHCPGHNCWDKSRNPIRF